MNQSNTPVTQLALQCCEYLEQLGYEKHAIWSSNYSHYMCVMRHHLECNTETYDPVIADEYLQKLIARYDQGEISYSHVKTVRKAVDQLNEFYNTGAITRLQMKKGSKYVLTETNSSLLEGFLNSKPFHPNTREDFAWVIRMYLFYFQQKGKNDIQEFSNEDVRGFIVEKASVLSASSMKNILCYLKQFYQYLSEQGIKVASSQDLFSYRIRREYHVNNYVSDEDAERIIAAIDTKTPKGKRNLAIILLGYINGMRAADVVTLRLSDIKWEKGIIRVLQQKTGNYTDYPLLDNVAGALRDYIFNARPKTEYQEVFLRASAPFRPLTAGASVEHIFRYQCDVAGVKREPFDGRAFHGLRRRLGHNMLLSGFPVSTISQTLGHLDMQAARQYMKINSKELRACSLDFSGIPVKRRSLI